MSSVMPQPWSVMLHDSCPSMILVSISIDVSSSLNFIAFTNMFRITVVIIFLSANTVAFAVVSLKEMSIL